MSYTRAILMNQILDKRKVDVKHEVIQEEEEEVQEKKMEDNPNSSMMQRIMEIMNEELAKHKNPAPVYQPAPKPQVGERIGIMLSQAMLGFDPSMELINLVNEVKRHHPVDDTHTLRKVEVKRMEDGTYSLFVEWMKHEYEY